MSAEARADQRDIDMHHWGLTPLQRIQHLARVSAYHAHRARAQANEAQRLAHRAAILTTAALILTVITLVLGH